MQKKKKLDGKVSIGMMLIAIGVVYGDIGTSPLYVMKSIIEGNGGLGEVSSELIIGSLSLIIWTITILTTVKYVLIAMKADNHGEGGIFSLYSLVKKYGKFLVVFAMIGGAALLADGVLTPAVTVTTAIEGLRSIQVMNTLLGESQSVVIIITLVIIAVLFSVQRAGTSKIGRAFGPVMLIWFSFLGVTGLLHMFDNIQVLSALNPILAIKLLFSPYNKIGFMILGSVFLATTGAEALYSDMGHVGRQNIYASWPFVKICLILNYAGQCSWIISNLNNASLLAIEDMNPFFLMLPEALRPVAVLMSAAAAIIASQALITGSYTLVSEAISLDLMPHMEIRYPSETKGQLYIGFVNTVIWIACSFVVLYFRTSARMEAAYGLSITVTMLTTTILLSAYIANIKKSKIGAILMLVLFGSIESIFFISSLSKFAKGGYFAVMLAAALFLVMVIWHRGTNIEKSQNINLKMRDYLDKIDALRKDKTITKCADNVVFLTSSANPEYIERDILYSILNRDSKRATAYWFLNVNTTGKSNEASYTVETYGTDYVYYVRFNLGFKLDRCINVYLRQVVSDLLNSKELPKQKKLHSIYGPSDVGNFKFCVIHKTLSSNSALSAFDAFVIRSKYLIRKIVGSKVKWFGLENVSLIMENVPLFIAEKPDTDLVRK